MVRVKENKGQALVELAFVLPILLLIIMGIIEFGRIFNAYLIITNASREGARYAALGSDNSEIEAVVDQLTTTLDQSQITIRITPNYTSRTSGSPVKVEIEYDLEIIAPIISTIIGNPYEVSAETTMRIE